MPVVQYMSHLQEEFALLDQARSMGFSVISPRRSSEGFQFRREGWCVWRCIYNPTQWVVAPVSELAAARTAQYYRESLDEALILAMLSADACEPESVLLSA